MTPINNGSRSIEGNSSTSSSGNGDAVVAFPGCSTSTSSRNSRTSYIHSIDASVQSTANKAANYVAKTLEETRGAASSIGSSTSLVFRKVFPTQEQKEIKEILKTYSSMESYHIHMQTKKELNALKILYNPESTVAAYNQALEGLNPIPKSSNSSKKIAADLQAKINEKSNATVPGARASALPTRRHSLGATISSTKEFGQKQLLRSQSWSSGPPTQTNIASNREKSAEHLFSHSNTIVATTHDMTNTQAAKHSPEATSATPATPATPQVSTANALLAIDTKANPIAEALSVINYTSIDLVRCQKELDSLLVREYQQLKVTTPNLVLNKITALISSVHAITNAMIIVKQSSPTVQELKDALTQLTYANNLYQGANIKGLDLGAYKDLENQLTKKITKAQTTAALVKPTTSSSPPSKITTKHSWFKWTT